MNKTIGNRVCSAVNKYCVEPQHNTQYKIESAKSDGRLIGSVQLPTKTVYAYTY